MNEKIKELFEQAYGGEWPTDITNIAPSELERFAKLIVNECANYAFSDDQGRNAMLKHFGVE